MTPFNLRPDIINSLDKNIVSIMYGIYAIKDYYPILTIELPGFEYDVYGEAIAISSEGSEDTPYASIIERDSNKQIIFYINMYIERNNYTVYCSDGHSRLTKLLDSPMPTSEQIHEIALFLKQAALVNIVEK